jgi:hypothetical protein
VASYAVGDTLSHVSPRRAWAIGVTLVSATAGFFFVAASSPLTGCYQCDYPCPSAFDVGPYCLTPSGSNQPSSCLIDGQPVTQCVPGSCPPWTLSSGETLTLPVGSLWSTLGPRDNLHWFIACLPPGYTPDASGQESAVQDSTAPESSSQESSALESSIGEAATQEASFAEASSDATSTDDASTEDASQAFVSAVPEMAGTLSILFDGVPAQGCICTPNTQITCARVPPTVQTIGFSYVQAPAPSLDSGSDAGSDEGSASESDAGLSSVVLSIAFDVGNCQPTHTGCPLSFVPEGSAD